MTYIQTPGTYLSSDSCDCCEDEQIVLQSLSSLSENDDSTPIDYPFKALVSWVFGQLGHSYYQAIAEIASRINYNRGFKCYPFQWDMLTKACFRNDEIEIVVNTYGNLALKKIIQEYSEKKLSEAELNVIIQTVSEVSGKPLARVELILKNLFWATKDGSVKWDALLRPNTYQSYYEMRTVPEEWDKCFWDCKLKNALFGSLKWIFIVGGIVGVAYVYPKLPKHLQPHRKLLKGKGDK